jgi:hypothetical protein
MPARIGSTEKWVGNPMSGSYSAVTSPRPSSSCIAAISAKIASIVLPSPTPSLPSTGSTETTTPFSTVTVWVISGQKQ